MPYIWVIEWSYGRQESPHLALFVDERDALAMSKDEFMAIIREKLLDSGRVDRYGLARAMVGLSGCYPVDDALHYVQYDM